MIPSNELLNRLHFGWFVRMSPKQVLESDTIIGNYLLLSIGPEDSQGSLEPLEMKPNWVGFWKTPLYPGLYGLKPDRLGNNLNKVPYYRKINLKIKIMYKVYIYLLDEYKHNFYIHVLTSITIVLIFIYYMSYKLPSALLYLLIATQHSVTYYNDDDDESDTIQGQIQNDTLPEAMSYIPETEIVAVASREPSLFSPFGYSNKDIDIDISLFKNTCLEDTILTDTEIGMLKDKLKYTKILNNL